MTIALGAFVFLAVFLGIFTVNLILTDLFKEDRSRQLKEMEAELRQQMREAARRATQQVDASWVDGPSTGPRQFSIIDLMKQFRQIVHQSGTKSNAQWVGFVGLAGGAVLGLLAFFLTNSLVLALAMILVGGAFPVFYIFQKRQQRMNQLAEQLPDALELMARVLRAGQTVPQALNGVADEFVEPIGTEFGFCYEQQNLGLPLEVALNNMVERTGLIEIKILVMAINVQRQAGGNLAELLDKLSDVMRQRQLLKGSIRSLTAEGRMQATVLAGLPFVTWIAMLFINREYAMKLLQHPPLIYGTVGLMALGIVWIRKIVNFEF